ncbi:MAG: hypothetical protein Q4G39_08310 [Brachymonas sp.]|nr:hypothetical protein [Brachymonas sp.]
MHEPQRAMHLARLGIASAICGMTLAACSAPPLPNNTPTKEEVPFLGQQMTQEQINQWRDQIDTKRQTLQQTLSAQKQDCYQRFFVNACLNKSIDAYRAQDRVLRLQENELARQERVLTGIDRQLRLQEKAQPPQPAASKAP